ncbi:MAG: nucleotidyltransferase family protein [Bdellovibrionaceae bacterium]|nr:nucleotidyltransferase family protein [Pseudobdellovibrionaceae bacterium]
MGPRNKLLLPMDGGTLVRRTAKELAKFPFQESVFVTGYEADLVTPELISFDAILTHNARYKEGMSTSLKAGLRALTKPCDGVVIVHGDRPSFRIEVVQRLAQEFYKRRGPLILFPRWRGRRGHPTLVSRHFFDEILNEFEGDYDLGYLMRRSLNAVLPIDVEDVGVTEDLDIPEDVPELSRCHLGT